MESSDSNHGEQFFSEFIDELYAEYDERLGLVRRDLLSLESFIDQPSIDQNLLDALLRHFHTLKGLAGTINLKEAEQLTHQMENYLRGIRQQQVNISNEGMSVLITGTKVLEQFIVAHRTGNTLPETASILAELTTISPDAPPSAPSEPSPEIPTADEGDERVWRFEFVPSHELAERGINVNVIRARLEEIGEVLQAMPRLAEGEAGLVFEFLVSTDVEESHFADWENDGLTYALSEPSLPSTPDEKLAEQLTVHTNAQTVLNTATTPTLAPSNMVRVDMARLDELMRLIGELVMGRARQENNLTQIKPLVPTSQWRILQETNLAIERQLRDLREGVMRVRLVPIGTAFERMQFVVRDIAGETQKSVKLALSGQDTEIDKFVVDKMIDPLLHLVRNAVSHGIEFTEERVDQGKPPEGLINLRAYTIGDAMIIEIEDDGHGINTESITAKAYSQGLIDSMDAILDSTRLLDILCQPGFTTQEHADLASGRGVGMDVVKNTVNELGGFINLDTKIGVGTRFTIQLPLTLAIADALIVSVAGQRFAVPRLSVREVIEVEQTTVTTLENNEIISHRDGILPLLRIGQLFNLQTDWKNRFYVLIVGSSNTIGIAVDRILGEREIVVRALHDPLVQVPGIAGASELGDGRIVLILDVAALTRVTHT